jgi:uncharacterized glyoxalase superfamily protein PhnB
MLQSAIPVLCVSESGKAEDYYCRVLGFRKTFAYRPDPNRSDPCYMGVQRDGVTLHLHSFKTERAGKTDTFINVIDIDKLYSELKTRGANIQLPPTDQTWGNREMGVRDQDGNALVFANAPSKR